LFCTATSQGLLLYSWYYAWLWGGVGLRAKLKKVISLWHGVGTTNVKKVLTFIIPTATKTFSLLD